MVPSDTHNLVGYSQTISEASGGGRYFWMGMQTFAMGPQTAWAPWNEGPYSIFCNAVFTDIGAFFKS